MLYIIFAIQRRGPSIVCSPLLLLVYAASPSSVQPPPNRSGHHTPLDDFHPPSLSPPSPTRFRFVSPSELLSARKALPEVCWGGGAKECGFTFVPLQAQPLEVLQHCILRVLGGARPVCVLHPMHRCRMFSGHSKNTVLTFSPLLKSFPCDSLGIASMSFTATPPPPLFFPRG